jgi:hypothetical protein
VQRACLIHELGGGCALTAYTSFPEPFYLGFSFGKGRESAGGGGGEKASALQARRSEAAQSVAEREEIRDELGLHVERDTTYSSVVVSCHYM